MKLSELVSKLRQYSNNYVTTDKYCIQVYASGNRGNIQRLDRTVVCAFDIVEDGLMIAPAKDNCPYEFGYTRYKVGMNDDVECLAHIQHKNSKEIFEAFNDFMNNN